jgi:hypothetical protein
MHILGLPPILDPDSPFRVFLQSLETISAARAKYEISPFSEHLQLLADKVVSLPKDEILLPFALKKLAFSFVAAGAPIPEDLMNLLEFFYPPLDDEKPTHAFAVEYKAFKNRLAREIIPSPEELLSLLELGEFALFECPLYPIEKTLRRVEFLANLHLFSFSDPAIRNCSAYYKVHTRLFFKKSPSGELVFDIEENAPLFKSFPGYRDIEDFLSDLTEYSVYPPPPAKVVKFLRILKPFIASLSKEAKIEFETFIYKELAQLYIEEEKKSFLLSLNSWIYLIVFSPKSLLEIPRFMTKIMTVSVFIRNRISPRERFYFLLNHIQAFHDKIPKDEKLPNLSTLNYLFKMLFTLYPERRSYFDKTELSETDFLQAGRQLKDLFISLEKPVPTPLDLFIQKIESFV